MSAPSATDAAACPKATAALWEKLAEVLLQLSNQPDAKELFCKYTILRSVVGEVKPVFADALRIQLKVFDEEERRPSPAECDELEAVSIHIVAYFNYTLFSEEMEELAVQARLLKSIGMEGSGLRFQRRKSGGSSGDAGGGDDRQAAESKPKRNVERAPSEGRYVPPVMIPVGCVRLHRASKVPRAGKLLEVVAKVERLCVLTSVRHFDVGRTLMSAAESTARDVFHVRWALLYAPLESRDFYAKVGYAPKDGWVFHEEERPHIVMVKCLADASL